MRPHYLSTDTIERVRQDMGSRPHARYAVLDGFFLDEPLGELHRQHVQLPFKDPVHPTPYDSCLVSGRPGQHPGSELFFAEVWQEFLGAYTGNRVTDAAATKVMHHRHHPRAKGCWIHLDRIVQIPATSVALMYLNKGWQTKDGGLLQFWSVQRERPPLDGRAIRFVNRKNRRLDFLSKHELTIEVGSYPNLLRPLRLSKTDQIVPIYNRVVLCDLVTLPAYHSVTPTNSRVRYDIAQRVF